MAPYSMAGLLSCASERVFVTWSGSYHLTKEASRFILSVSHARRSPWASLSKTSRRNSARHQEPGESACGSDVIGQTPCRPPGGHTSVRDDVAVAIESHPLGEQCNADREDESDNIGQHKQLLELCNDAMEPAV